MPIVRTPIIDDSGSGTDGTVLDNAWKQQLYDQIDAMAGPLAPVYGTWAPVDASGAGLSFVGTSGYYAKNGRVLILWASVNWPATANGAAAKVGGLPFANSLTQAGLYVAYGPANLWLVQGGASQVLVYNATNPAAARTNAEMSGSNNVLVGALLLP